MLPCSNFFSDQTPFDGPQIIYYTGSDRFDRILYSRLIGYIYRQPSIVYVYEYHICFGAISSAMIRYATSKFRVLGTIRQSVLTNCWVGKLGRSTSRGELAELGVVRKIGTTCEFILISYQRLRQLCGSYSTSNSSRCQRNYIQARRIKEATCRSLFQSIIIRGKLCWMLDR